MSDIQAKLRRQNELLVEYFALERAIEMAEKALSNLKGTKRHIKNSELGIKKVTDEIEKEIELRRFF